MISEKRRDLYAGGLVFLIGSGAAIIGSKYTIGSLTKMGPGFFPAALGVVLFYYILRVQIPIFRGL